MLIVHPPSPPPRVVVLGAKGFVGSAVMSTLATAGHSVVGIGSSDLNLLGQDAPDRLAQLLRPDDSLVVVSAKAPTRTVGILAENIRMLESVCSALAQKPTRHVVYISSDAVYGEEFSLVSEATPATGESLHGRMHSAREAMLKQGVKCPLAILRPSLLYGARDPHNGYGPNRFRRLAAEGKPIVLFGEGEELRDHVFVEDLARVALRVILARGQGILNVATGESVSFRRAAEMAVALFGPGTPIQPSPRQTPVTHRHFDRSALIRAFPDFGYTPLASGLAQMRQQLNGGAVNGGN